MSDVPYCAKCADDLVDGRCPRDEPLDETQPTTHAARGSTVNINATSVIQPRLPLSRISLDDFKGAP